MSIPETDVVLHILEENPVELGVGGARYVPRGGSNAEGDLFAPDGCSCSLDVSFTSICLLV
jgi:hypothetical protein